MKLFVACSSKDVDEKYIIKCMQLLNELAENNDLVFGAYNKGLMKLSYDIFKNNQRKVIGVTTDKFSGLDDSLIYDELIQVKDIASRTMKCIELSDAIIVLPGGFGTLNELFMTLDIKRCQEINKPIVIYNIYNYYNNVIRMIDKVYNEGMGDRKIMNQYLVSTNIKEIIKYITNK